MMEDQVILTVKDFETDQDIRWCPGCGDFSILKQMQIVLPKLGIPKEKIVFVSGIGCSSRFPYYMNTYGIHTIHGRATAIATGLKCSRPDLSVWIITGDGDALSIGGNHLIHFLRRNVNANLLLFNNEIYGLTKGQYSPTSRQNHVTKSSPLGSIDFPFNTISVALGADATFVGRTIDREARHLQYMIKEAEQHQGSSFVEIYQNCNIFNDRAFIKFTNRQSRKENTIFLVPEKPLVFGENESKGIKVDGFTPRIVDMKDHSPEDLWIHDPSDLFKAQALSRFSDIEDFPRPFGIFYKKSKPSYDQLINEQLTEAIRANGKGDLNELLRGNEVWEV